MALSRSRRSTSPQTHPRPDISRCMNLRYSLHTREIIIPSPLNSTLDHVAPQGHHLHDQPLALRRCHEVGSLSRAWGCHCSAYPRDVQGLTTQKVLCSNIDFLKTSRSNPWPSECLYDSFNFVFYIVGECISCAADTLGVSVLSKN